MSQWRRDPGAGWERPWGDVGGRLCLYDECEDDPRRWHWTYDVPYDAGAADLIGEKRITLFRTTLEGHLDYDDYRSPEGARRSLESAQIDAEIACVEAMSRAGRMGRRIVLWDAARKGLAFLPGVISGVMAEMGVPSAIFLAQMPTFNICIEVLNAHQDQILAGLEPRSLRNGTGAETSMGRTAEWLRDKRRGDAEAARFAWDRDGAAGVLTWSTVLTSGLAEVLLEDDPKALRRHLLCVMGTLSEWIEDIDRKEVKT